MEEQLKLSRRLQARIRELEHEKHAALAVVGMAMRLPGDVDSPQSYWDFLRGDGDAYRPIPEDRPGLRAVYDPTPGKPGRSYVQRAGFLSDLAGFDADFFGISQREARLLDPQQRLLLETAWEALERAGIAVRRADRLDAGVYLGMMASEYTERFEDRADMTRIDPYYTTGGGLCFAAGRISHVMGLRGPVFSVDTACSSSLSALHLAARGLRGRECKYALVCGSNLLLSASLMVSLCQTRALSPEGRSKSFLATADGYGRGEGVGVMVLMRLDEAEREGRPILAVVRGTAVNHDGAASGLTVPNGPAQQEVIRAALDEAGVQPGDLGWIEAHGTGTPLGDPIEVGALDAVLGAAVRDRGVPLPIGSVKSRLGHLEAASGIAAVLKTVLMLHHGEIPAAASPEDGELNPHIPWDRLGFTVPRQNQPWPDALPRRVAGVNSFGMSGTNAHVVMEAYQARPNPAPVGPRPAGSGPELVTVSAAHPAALERLIGSISGRLRSTDPAALASVCHTLRAGRAHFAHRVSVTGSTPAQLADALAAALAEAQRGQAGSGNAARSVILRTAAQHADALAASVAALTEAFPGLAGDSAADPADSFANLLRRLGLHVRVERGGGQPSVADLEWPGAGGRATRMPLASGNPAQAPALLLEALSAIYNSGADLRFDALRPAGAQFVGDLPTYPFQRKHFWVEEPDPAVPDGAPQPTEQSRAAPAASDRVALADYLLTELRDALQADELEPARSFLDTGGDSFTFTLFISKIEENFKLRLTPDDLPLELPVTELIDRIADDIGGLARTGALEHSA
jgi:acyl transferase domain-containing protein